ncbi:hypothetical protein OIU74_012995 [Salix koriyanagi]|uniref:Uncharacterized protein n=1 Tax=Salix koriyanagi TaxID=2511006 RepID=A0A9Q0Q8E6_9ROSI|nr:hypothetical protein OIU74_012995 [Salix koriyanagi]
MKQEGEMFVVSCRPPMAGVSPVSASSQSQPPFPTPFTILFLSCLDTIEHQTSHLPFQSHPAIPGTCVILYLCTFTGCFIIQEE